MLDRITRLGDRLLTRLVPTTTAAAALCAGAVPMTATAADSTCWTENCGSAPCAARQCCRISGVLCCGNCYAVC